MLAEKKEELVYAAEQIMISNSDEWEIERMRRRADDLRIEQSMKEELASLKVELAEKKLAIAKEGLEMAEKDLAIAETKLAMAEKDLAIAKKDAEIIKLQNEIEWIKLVGIDN